MDLKDASVYNWNYLPLRYKFSRHKHRWHLCFSALKLEYVLNGRSSCSLTYSWPMNWV
jgi:hypothetical protein